MSSVSAVREVKLRLRIPESVASEARTLRAHVEHTFLHNVLDAFEREVHACLGPRAIVRIQRLPLRWKLGQEELRDLALQDRLGRELADGVLEKVSRPPSVVSTTRGTTSCPRPLRDAPVVVLVDDAHALAVALAERAEGWPVAHYHLAPTVEQLWQHVIDGGDRVIDAVLELLAAYEVTVAELDRRDLPRRLRARIADLRARDLVVASPLAIENPPRPFVETGNREDMAPAFESAVRDPGSTEGEPDGAGARPSHPAGIRVLHVPGAVREHIANSDGVITETSHAPIGVATEVGGLFFLLSRVAELELGEHLWCAGISEGPAVARALALLVPHELRDDPSFAVIAGTAPETVCPADWAVQEVVDKTHRALASWLVERGAPPGDTMARCARIVATLDREATPLHATIAAAVCAVVCERLGRSWQVETARDLALRRGSIVDGDDIVIELAAAHAEVELRVAGLDFNPGWIPWLSRRVRVTYAVESW